MNARGLCAGFLAFGLASCGASAPHQSSDHGGPAAHASATNCTDYSDQAAAQRYFHSRGGSSSNDVDGLDTDHDGKACESLPCPCGTAGGGGEKKPAPPEHNALFKGRCRRGVLPDRRCSPGRKLPVSAPEVCVPGYSARVRNVPQARKDEVYAAYGIRSHRPHEYEIDHLISLELGGSNSTKNLFPEAYGGGRGAEDKDRLENRLHALVCSGEMSLARAQRAISGNWLEAFKRYVAPG